MRTCARANSLNRPTLLAGPHVLTHHRNRIRISHRSQCRLNCRLNFQLHIRRRPGPPHARRQVDQPTDIIVIESDEIEANVDGDVRRFARWKHHFAIERA